MLKKLIVDPRIKTKTFAELFHEPPIIVRVTEFDEKGAKEFTEAIEKAENSGQPMIPVLIDSYGGHVYSLIEMISQIQNSKIPVITICEGKAMSCGAMLFGMGHQRYMSSNATLMIHDVSNMAWGKVEEVKASAKETDRLNKLIFGLVAKNCRQSEDYFLKIIHEKSHAEWYLPPKEAKKHNLCTDLGVPNFSVQIKLEYNIG